MSTPALTVYRQLLKNARLMKQYNYREYALRTIRNRFRENANETDSAKISELLAEAQRNNDVLQRQAQISRMYAHDSSILEGPASGTK